MKAAIHPSNISGIVQAPASKSSMQRALAAAYLTKGKSIILNAGFSNDDKAAISIIKELGATAEVNQAERTVTIEKKTGTQTQRTIHCGESGLSMRMFTPIAALQETEILITGEGSLVNRPMNFFDEILPQLGVTIQSNDGKLPISVKGPLQPKNIEIDGSLSSQFLTGLLMAYSAACAKNVSIKVKNLKSKPYINLTLDVMKQFGMKLPVNKNYSEFYFSGEGPGQTSNHHEYTAEGDWSGGAFLLVAAAVAGPVTVHGLDLNSSQADKKIMDALYNANASVAIEAKGIKVRPAKMTAFKFDATDCPDLFPPLVVLAASCMGSSRITGVKRLFHKESNRAKSLQTEFGKMGIDVSINDDEMIVTGGKLKAAVVSSHHDHRIAMACTVAGLIAEGEVVIENAEAVNKSYPAFFNDLKKLGADVSLDNKLRFS